MKELKLYTFKEKWPQHDDYIIYFTNGNYGSCSVRFGEVEYYWINEDGQTISYNGEDKSDPDLNGYWLEFSVDNITGLHEFDDNWAKVEDFYSEPLEKIN